MAGDHPTEPNSYTAEWFRCFLDALPQERTDREVAAVMERLPQPDFKSILDVSCGSGRHAARLAAAGYSVTGVDRDLAALALAEGRAPTATFQPLDQRQLSELAGPFDGVLLLWQSFGYFSPTENDSVLQAIAGLLRPGGRLLIDVFHPEYFRKRQGRRKGVPAGVAAVDEWFHEGRLCSRITYVDGTSELMDFEIFTPEKLAARAEAAGLHTLEACCWWDRRRPPDPDEARYHMTLQAGS